MTWNYRIIRYADGKGYGLHEIFYDDGEPTSMTRDAISFIAILREGPEDIVRSLRNALEDAEAQGVLDESAIVDDPVSDD